MDKQNFGKNNESIFDRTSESEDSSSSNPYESQPFILDLHEISKDNPSPEHVKKVKKTKKKKKIRSQASVSSESTTNSVVPERAALDELPREEFYDAHESYHALPESQMSNPVAAVAIAQAHSEHGQEPKILDPILNPNLQTNAPSQGQTSVAQKQPSAITKPVTGPE